jgi:hypothetical protein
VLASRQRGADQPVVPGDRIGGRGCDPIVLTARSYLLATNQIEKIDNQCLPQLSNVAHYVSDDGTIRISSTASRAKYHNLSWAYGSRQRFAVG